MLTWFLLFTTFLQIVASLALWHSGYELAGDIMAFAAVMMFLSFLCRVMVVILSRR